MILKKFSLGPAETNTYLIGCSKTHQMAVIDAPLGAAEVVIAEAQREKGNIVAILLTHSHWDHIVDVRQLQELLHVPVNVHAEDAANVQEPGVDGLPLFFSISGAKPDGLLKDGDTFKIGELSWEVIHTPGHSPGGVCFYCAEEKTLISGDTLFRGSIGNLSFPTADPQKMRESLKRLSEFPPETRVYPGHGEATTIERERKTFMHFGGLLS